MYRLCLPHATPPQALGIAETTARDIIRVVDGYKGKGYAISSPHETAFIEQVGRTTGILLDPVYTGMSHASQHALCLTGMHRQGCTWAADGAAGQLPGLQGQARPVSAHGWHLRRNEHVHIAPSHQSSLRVVETSESIASHALRCLCFETGCCCAVDHSLGISYCWAITR